MVAAHHRNNNNDGVPAVEIRPGATVFVTGVNGLIGSHVVDQLLALGYHVRGAVRDVGKSAWLHEFFGKKYPHGKFELVEVVDMSAEGCYDLHVRGVEGFIHVASPVGTVTDVDVALQLGNAAVLNALNACAKEAGVKSFVNTSSMFAATFPRPHDEKEFHVTVDTYNDVVEEARRDDAPQKNILVYAAMKAESEKAMWKWAEEKKPSFRVNCVVPYANFGPVLVPEHQGYPSTIDWARPAWTGTYLAEYTKAVSSQGFISLRDCALLHISALIHGDVRSERLFGSAERWTYNRLLAVFRKNYPEKKFPEDVEGLREDMVRAPTERAEEVLRLVKGEGWDGLEQAVIEMSKEW